MTAPDGDPVAMDTSAAVPLLMLAHPAHLRTRRQLAGRPVALTAHSLAETYSVLTRLPGDARLTAADAAALVSANFIEAIAPPDVVVRHLPGVLAPLGICGGAVYDAMVGLAAQSAGSVLLTRDARAIPTYSAVGARIEIIA
jgi:hypothetical protein